MKKLVFISMLFGALLLSTPQVSAGTTLPPPPGHSKSGNQSPAGGSAPIGGGLFILLGLGAAYGGKKVYNYFSEEKEELEN